MSSPSIEASVESSTHTSNDSAQQAAAAEPRTSLPLEGADSEQIDNNIGSVLTRVPSEADTCPICKEPFENQAKVLPCGHKFDVTCILSWVNQTPRGAGPTLCPICRGQMLEIRHYPINPHNSPAKSTPNPQLVVINLQRDLDEIILPGMTEREVHAAQERRRLRGLERRREVYRIMLPQPQDFWVKRRKYFGKMIEYYHLLIVQDGLVTTSKLKTFLVLDCRHEDKFERAPEHRTDRAALEVITEARVLLKTLLAKYVHDNTTSTVTIEHAKDEIERDERGISSTLERKVKLTVLGRKNGVLEQKLILVERGPANADGDTQPMGPDERPACGRRIRRVAADVRAILQETVNQGGDELDRAITNLLEGDDLVHFESDGRSASPESRNWRRVRRTGGPVV